MLVCCFWCVVCGAVLHYRLTTIRNADVIMFVKGGKVVEQGSHEALVAQVDGGGGGGGGKDLMQAPGRM